MGFFANWKEKSEFLHNVTTPFYSRLCQSFKFTRFCGTMLLVEFQVVYACWHLSKDNA